jgi:hypothetical protein
MRLLKYFLAGCFIPLILSHCAKEPTDVLSSLKEHPTPTIANIAPAEGFGGEEATVTGTGFSTDPSKNMITFGPNPAFGYRSVRAFEATETTLKFVKPVISGSAGINITAPMRVFRMDDAKQSRSNPLEVVFWPLYYTTVIDTEIAWPMGVDVDADTNVYVGSANDEVIYKIMRDGTKSEFAAVPVKGNIHFGPENYLYVCEMSNDKIVRISPDGTTVEDVVEVAAPVDFDWDQSKNMYIAANDSGIFKLDAGGALDFVAKVVGPKACRVFGDHLYVTDINWDAEGSIYKFKINPGGLGSPEVVVDGDRPLGFDIDKNGTLYFAKTDETSLFTMTQSGVEGVIYQEELMSPMRYITFFGKAVYAVYPGWGEVGMVMRANIGIQQAPRYGRP